MPSLRVRIVIVAFWIAMTAWVVWRDLLPRLGYGEITYRSLLAGRAAESTSPWQVSYDGKRIGSVLSGLQPRPDGSFRLRSLTNLGTAAFAPELGRTTLYLNSEVIISPLGRLRTFKADLSVENSPINMSIEGTVEGSELVLRTNGMRLPLVPAESRVPFDPATPLGDALAPQDKLPGLWTGRTWMTRTVDPLALLLPALNLAGNESTTVVYHRVVGKESITWQNRPWMCHLVEHRHRDVAAKTWVRISDDQVLVHEVPVGSNKLVLVLDPPPKHPGEG